MRATSSLNDERRWFNNSSLLFLNFLIMMMCFSINHGTVTAVLALASQPSILGSELGGYSSGTLYIFYTLSAMTITAWIVGKLGGKYGLASGLFLYCFYVGSFLLAAKIPSIKWYAALIGSGVGGFGAGWLWTAQGVYFSRTAECFAKARGVEVSDANSLLAGLFATTYVGFELLLKGGSSLLQMWGGVDLVYIVFIIAAVTSSVLLTIFCRAFPPKHNEKETTPTGLDVLKKLTMAMKLLGSNRKMMLLAPFEITFGFVSAYLNNYVNGYILEDAIGTENVGYMAAVIPGVATLLSLPYSKLGNIVGKKWLMLFGTANWIAVAASIAIPSQDQILGMGWGLVYIYILAGSGRAVFEATNKAVFADFFPNDKPGAFANLILLSGGSSSLGFFLFPHLTGTYELRWIMASMTIGFGVLAIVCLLIAFRINDREKLENNEKSYLIKQRA